MASAQVVETSVNANNSPSQDYTTSPDDHSNHNIDSPGFKPFTVINNIPFYSAYVITPEEAAQIGANKGMAIWKEDIERK